MSSLFILQVVAIGLVAALLVSVRRSLRASDGPQAAPAPAIVAKPQPAAMPAPPVFAEPPAVLAPPMPVAYDKPRLVSSTTAPVPAPAPLALDDDTLSAEEEIALLERERDAALQQSAAAWKLLVQTRAERDRLREELEQARAALAAAEEQRALEGMAPKRAKTPRRRSSPPAAAKSAS